MATLTINDKTYDIDKLPDDAKAQLINLQFVDAELARLSATAAVFQTARIGYPLMATQIPPPLATPNSPTPRWTRAGLNRAVEPS